MSESWPQNASNESVLPPVIAWRHPLLAILLGCFCVITVAGNCLVVLAVCTKRYLRNPTGYLIISLAIADLIVGLVVMPLNSLYEMTSHVWILGLTMCDIFHALDILASTSSIWNLCIISLDRYMAGKDPIGYRDKVSKRRIRIAILFVWIVSAGLSFPAIAFWRETTPHLYENPYQCIFTDSVLYLSFSSLITFYIPLGLILFAYGKVYVIATRHSRGNISGIKKIKGGKSGEGSPMLGGDDGSALRVHFGRGIGRGKRSAKGTATGKLLLAQLPCKVVHPPKKDSIGNYSTSSFRVVSKNEEEQQLLRANGHGRTQSPLAKTQSAHNFFAGDRMEREEESALIVTTIPSSPLPSNEPTPRSSRRPIRKRVGVREKSRQMMKYVHEQRAARTLSIVVGAFILCWTPFFIFSPIAALCGSCFSNKETMFTIFTWAGHLNSMLNPLIYSRFSRDFRRAFKQILTCHRERKTKAAIRTPLSLVFTQLISITQFWEQPEEEER
ncbi:unnamed protein product, partial [Mesorhabditis belari]|uniref:G-protein coupled receptors family 1 profile domain-containing protein n=1 Tax=Mesorhabditis belari TaxID=2138241 RepID=A0AAF3EH03_9BILA